MLSADADKEYLINYNKLILGGLRKETSKILFLLIMLKKFFYLNLFFRNSIPIK